MNAPAAVWIVLVTLIALISIPSVLTLQNGLTWALSWTAVGAAGAYGLTRLGKRRRRSGP